jgi:hypothetical protein
MLSGPGGEKMPSRQGRIYEGVCPDSCVIQDPLDVAGGSIYDKALVTPNAGVEPPAQKRRSLAGPLARQSLRAVRSSWRRRAGSATTSISTIFPRVTVRPSATSSRPRGATTTPTAPFTSAGCAKRARPE